MEFFNKFLIKCTLVSMVLISTTALYANSPKLFVDNTPTIVDCIIKNNTTLVPLRFLTEQMGYKVDWSSKKQPIIISKEAHQSTLFATVTVDSNTVNNNGNVTSINQAPVMRDGIVYVPIRFICESFNCSVQYVDGNVYITSLASNQEAQTPSASTNNLPTISTSAHLAYLDSNGCFDFNKYNEIVYDGKAIVLNAILLKPLKKIPGFSDMHHINLIFQPTDQSKTLVLYTHPETWSFDSDLSDSEKATLTNDGMLIELKYDNSGFTVNSVKTIKNTTFTINTSPDSYIDQAITLYKSSHHDVVSVWGYGKTIGNPSYTLTGYKTYILENYMSNDVTSFEETYKDDLDKLTQ